MAKPYYGTINLKDWMLDSLTGARVMAIRGMVSCVEAADLAGFKLVMGGNSADWCAKIENPDTGLAVYVLGCQVRAFTMHERKKGQPAVETQVVY